MTFTLLNNDDLLHLGNTRKFEGYLFDNSSVSFFLVDVVTGKGALQHTHPYEEIHIIQEGIARYTIDGEELEVHPGQIIIVPPETPHGFVNIGTERFKAIGLHPVPKMIQHDLETVSS